MIASNDTLSNPANFTPPTRSSLFHAARCKAKGGKCLRHAVLNVCRSAVAPYASSPRVVYADV